MTTIAIVGAGPGLGAAVAERFGREGFSVALISRNPETLAGLVGGLAASGISGKAYPADAQQVNDIGRFDALIHNAGVLSGPEVFAVNTVAPYVLTALMTPPARSIFSAARCTWADLPTSACALNRERG